ncbi:DUF1801 domain-containing protein [Candidatus Parcubacteria bacterium]|nr:MAG: DUF1801 domain-containing protein [Candidatus Parcubacteria bacterium]
MAELKTRATKASAVDFIKKVPDEQKRKDGLELLKIFTEVTGEKTVMWGSSIVGFGTYHYKSERSTQEGDWPLTGFSPRKQNLTVYIMSGAKKYGPLLNKLGKHKVSGGSCIYINKLDDVDTSVLKQIIKKSYAEMKKKYKA